MPDLSRIIQVALVEDDAIVRDGLRQILQEAPQFACVGAFASGEEAIEALTSLPVDVVLIDIQLPGMSGIDCIRILSQQQRHISFMVLSVFEDSEKIMNSLAAGAAGYLLKHTPGNNLLEAIQEVHQGRSPISPEIALRVLESIELASSERMSASVSNISEEDRRVLQSVSKGLTSREIALKLNLRIEDIGSRIREIYRKVSDH